MNNTQQNTYIACPTCKKQAIWSISNPSRPFCSDRCKLIDLGEWASGNYAIPQTDSEEDEIMTTQLSQESGY
ncbi:DNA gyrase inhibitor YacG [Marinomonas sp. 2405UD68-3]|uniref:DNA gyrase inhibitor YacG n=1 Tax=Marinomonas sp. 2405UD68-3 TaxID=3391835 RepID=UPI0039C99889